MRPRLPPRCSHPLLQRIRPPSGRCPPILGLGAGPPAPSREALFTRRGFVARGVPRGGTVPKAPKPHPAGEGSWVGASQEGRISAALLKSISRLQGGRVWHFAGETGLVFPSGDAAELRAAAQVGGTEPSPSAAPQPRSSPRHPSMRAPARGGRLGAC